jgi:hypothetical protein
MRPISLNKSTFDASRALIVRSHKAVAGTHRRIELPDKKPRRSLRPRRRGKRASHEGTQRLRFVHDLIFEWKGRLLLAQWGRPVTSKGATLFSRLFLPAFDAHKMGFMQELHFLEDNEELDGICGWQARCIQTGYERALSGELPFAFPDMPSDHLKFGFFRSHKAA